MSSGNSILLFRVCFLLFEIRGNQFQRKNISLLMKQSSSIFLSEEEIFCIVETYFSMNASFRVLETDFLSCTNHFLYIFQRILPVKAFFRLVETYIWTNPSFRLLEKGFSSRNGLLYLYWYSCQCKQFFRPVERYSSANCSFSLMGTDFLLQYFFI